MRRLILIVSFLISTLSAQSIDTLFYGNTRIVHNNPYGWGYIAGTNGYFDIGKYQRFDVIEEVTVVGAKIWMGLKHIVNTPDTITIVFKGVGYGAGYYDSLSGGPGATIASITTTLDVFDTTGAGNVFMLAQPFNVAGGTFEPDSIFIGIEWTEAADDTFALFCDADDEGENQFRAWEQLTGVDYTYQRFNEPSDFSWLLDSDLWIALLYKQGLLSVQDEKAGVPGGYALSQNYPNPFNPSTTISFSVPQPGDVTIALFDLLGKEVATVVNERLDAGRYSVAFSARSLPSGLYFYHMRAGNFSETKKMTLVK
jgi:hypothetical protein